MSKPDIKSGDLLRMLRERHEKAKGQWIVLSEVRNSTGEIKQARYADAIAICCSAASGFQIHGFEIKVSRSDLVQELMMPEKSAAIAAYCDRWWLVLPRATLLQDGELPTDWGLLTIRGKSLRIQKAAPQRSPLPLDRGFVASLLRSAHKESPSTDELDAERIKWNASAKENFEIQHRWLLDELDETKATLAEWEELIGDGIHSFHIKDLAARVRFARDANPQEIVGQIEQLRDQLSQALEVWKSNGEPK